MITAGDAYTAILAQYNHRKVPHESILIDIVYIDIAHIDIAHIDILAKKIDWNNLWLDTMHELNEWIKIHDINQNELINAMYTHAERSYLTASIRIALFIKWDNLETQTLFNLSTNFKALNL